MPPPQSPSTKTTTTPPQGPLLVREAPLLLEHDYLPMEAGYALNSEGMWHIAASTYMLNVTGPMITWWFTHIHDTATYLLWHPRDHVFSDWQGPRGTGEYIGGTHLVQEYIGGVLQSLNITFTSPSVYFGEDYEQKFAKAGYSTAICGRVGVWDRENNSVVYTGHLIHLIKEEVDGCRMRSRFWLGDIEGVTDANERAKMTPELMKAGLCKHATEEMAILARVLPDLYRTYSGDVGGVKPKI